MVIIRNRLAELGAAGPRQFAEIRNKLIVSTTRGNVGDLKSELSDRNLTTQELTNAPIVVAEPEDKIEDVLESLSDVGVAVGQVSSEVSRAREEGQGIMETTREILEATNTLLRQIRQLDFVESADFVNSMADYGPENLRIAPDEMADIAAPEEEPETLQDVLIDLGLPEAWKEERGSNASVAIFDTGYAEDLIDSSRIAGTFHADEVDSAFAPSEGHGTMCAGAAAANKEEGVPFDGAAPEANVFLIRTTGADGQIRSDLITRGWDWLISNRGQRPVVANHSYGVPICSTVRTKFCNNPTADMIEIATADPGITACYAAGNEAMYCGHRPSGFTNGITGHNSLEAVVTVGALLTNGREAQRYSSHGRGDCAPRSDPKPNVSSRIPKKTYYGTDEGASVKDMSTGPLGSGGGTSHASPLVTGMLALVQSKANRTREPLQTEEIKQIIRNNSEPPHRTQVNTFGFLLGRPGWDARFGFGQFNPADALGDV